MKAPEYVYEVTRIWRTLLDERRAATRDELARLAAAFSRGGFTDGYYTEHIDRSMLGIRSEEDKVISRGLQGFAGLTRKIPLSMQASITAGEPITLTLSDRSRSVSVCGEIPMEAINAPLSRENVERNLRKTGGTPYEIASLDLTLGDGLMLPLSKLNELRRRAIAAWEEGISPKRCEQDIQIAPLSRSHTGKVTVCTARFASPEQITPRAKAFFDRIALPLHRFTDAATNVILPPVIFNRDLDEVREMLNAAKEQGATSVTVGNLGHLPLARESGLTLYGDFRLNVTSTPSAAEMEALGFEELLLSPELTLPQIRDIKGNTAVTVYGRIPLMTLEKCVIREVADCKTCDANAATMTDRKGITFPLLREWKHRNLVLNSLPTCMSDKPEELLRFGITNRHFIFTVESPREVDAVIEAFQKGLPLDQKVRRLSR